MKKIKKKFYNFLARFFKEEIEQSFIEQELPYFELDLKDEEVLDSISELARSSEFRVFKRLLQNWKHNIGNEFIKKKYKIDESFAEYNIKRGESIMISRINLFIKVYGKLSRKKRGRGKRKEK